MIVNLKVEISGYWYCFGKLYSCISQYELIVYSLSSMLDMDVSIRGFKVVINSHQQIVLQFFFPWGLVYMSEKVTFFCSKSLKKLVIYFASALFCSNSSIQIASHQEQTSPVFILARWLCKAPRKRKHCITKFWK